MTSLLDAGDRPPTSATDQRRSPWPRAAVIGALLVLTFFASRSCQQAQIRVTEEQAIATAKEQVDFVPENTQIRLLRQGLDRRPFWIVSLSIPTDETDVFSRLALVRIDANTGKVESVEQQEPAKDVKKQAEAGAENQKEP